MLGGTDSSSSSTLTDLEARAQFAIWAAVKSNLVLSLNLSSASRFTIETITAPEVIALNQDALGVAADVIYHRGPWVIFAGPLADGGRAVVMWNRGTYHGWPQGNSSSSSCAPLDFRGCPATTANMTLSFALLGYEEVEERQLLARDLFLQTDLGVFPMSASLTVAVPAHGVTCLRLTPTTPAKTDTLWRPWDPPTPPVDANGDSGRHQWTLTAWVCLTVAAAEFVLLLWGVSRASDRRRAPLDSAGTDGYTAVLDGAEEQGWQRQKGSGVMS